LPTDQGRGFLAYPAGAVEVRTIMTPKAFLAKAAFVLDNGGSSPEAMVRLLIQVHSDFWNRFKRFYLACPEKCVGNEIGWRTMPLLTELKTF
jgi:hypothetical protein